MKLSHKHGW